jgi:hypothetical protein
MCLWQVSYPPPPPPNIIKRLAFWMEHGVFPVMYELFLEGVLWFYRVNNCRFMFFMHELSCWLRIYLINLQGCVHDWIWAFTDQVFQFVSFWCLKHFRRLKWVFILPYKMCIVFCVVLYLWSYCCRGALLCTAAVWDSDIRNKYERATTEVPPGCSFANRIYLSLVLTRKLDMAHCSWFVFNKETSVTCNIDITPSSARLTQKFLYCLFSLSRAVEDRLSYQLITSFSAFAYWGFFL